MACPHIFLHFLHLFVVATILPFLVWSDRLTADRSLAQCANARQCCSAHLFSSWRQWTATRPSRLLLVVTPAQSCCSGPFYRSFCSPQLPSISQLPLTTCRKIRLRSKSGVRGRLVLNTRNRHPPAYPIGIRPHTLALQFLTTLLLYLSTLVFI